MQPNWEIEQSILNNEDQFKHDFFKRFELRHNKGPLQLNDSISKNYLFPTFYSDVTCAIGIFLCSYAKAKAMLPHPDLEPVSMGKGRSLVIFTNYIYRNVMGVKPYNEIAMNIPIMVKPTWNVPMLPMVTNWFKNFGIYCFSMPVTSLENQIRGEKIWGLPKVVQEIQIENDGEYCHVTAKEESWETYYELCVPREGKNTHFDVQANLYTVKNGEFLQSPTFFKGDFHVNKNMGKLWGEGKKAQRDFLKIYDTPSGQVLKNLEIDPNPFQFRYAQSMTSCFDLPDKQYQSPITL